jgi:hypothetical protein
VIGSLQKVHAPGFVNDVPAITLPDGAWSDSRNVKYRDGAVEKCQGYTQTLGDLSTTAIWAAPISDGTNYFWAYASNTVMYATDGLSHANITGTITLGATDDLNFSGGAFHGYLIVNDGAGIPQSWSPGLGNDLVSLTAWISLTTKCRVMRSFKDFLFAFRIDDGLTYNPRMMLWSDRAAPNALPQSWDYTDPTNQAGINELAQTQDGIVDGLTLRDSLMIYKENHTWIADYIGTDDVFSFRQVFTQVGMLTERCAIQFGSQHLVWTDQDIVLHDGNAAQSILDKRARRWLFGRINQAKFKRCFAVADYRERTAYFCFPESGQDWPTLALAWNWAEDTLHPYELGGVKTWADYGIIPASGTSFDSDTGTFDSVSGAFDDENYSPFSGYMLLTDAQTKRAYQCNTGETYNGQVMTCYAERSAWPVKRDLIEMARVTRIYPRITGTPGDTVRFWIGVRTTQLASIQWYGPYNFTLGTDYKIDTRISGRLMDFRIEYSGTNTFRFSGMEYEFEKDGLR